MNTIYKLLTLCVLTLTVLTGCVEPFELPETAPDDSLLVVDGHINLEMGQAVVQLTRTQNLNEEGTPPAETGAQVSIENEQGESIPLVAQPYADGRYMFSGVWLGYGNKYRLRIKTRNGREYLSEFVSSQKTPAIDNLTWNVEREGVQVRVSTQDPTNSTRYYRWEYEETHEYSSSFPSFYTYVNRQPVRRENIMETYICWKNEPSKGIFIGTTAQLAEDVIKEMPLAFNLGNSQKFSRKYSILVKQYGISRQEFEYWQMLKKNTENVGSLFDAQPSQVTGNITRIDGNPEEPVFGYFSVRSVSQKRLYITFDELREYGFRRESQNCDLLSGSLQSLSQYLNSGFYQLVDELEPNVWGVATINCSDCRTMGGESRKPYYWE